MLDFTPNLLNLPSEILHLIYNSIERLQDKKNFSLVNKQFNATHRNNTKTLYLKEDNSITIEKSPQIFKNIKKLVIDCSMNTDPNSDQYYKTIKRYHITVVNTHSITIKKHNVKELI